MPSLSSQSPPLAGGGGASRPRLAWVWSGTSTAQEKKSCPTNLNALSFTFLGTMHCLAHLALPDQEGHGIAGVVHFSCGLAIQYTKSSHLRCWALCCSPFVCALLLLATGLRIQYPAPPKVLSFGGAVSVGAVSGVTVGFCKGSIIQRYVLHNSVPHWAWVAGQLALVLSGLIQIPDTRESRLVYSFVLGAYAVGIALAHAKAKGYNRRVRFKKQC